MRRRSTTSYQLLTSAFILTVGCVVGVIAIRIWENMIVEEAVQARIEVVRGLELACARAHTDRQECMRTIRSREGLGILSARLVDADGGIRAASGGPFAKDREERADVLAALREGRTSSFRETGMDGMPLTVVTPVAHPDRVGEALVVSFDMTSVNENVRRAVLHVLGLVGTLALVNFLTVGWLVRRWMKPIAEMTRRMREVRKGDYSVVVPEAGSDEIGDLARDFNAMLDAIRDARTQSLELARRQANIEKFAALGRLSSGVAHEINNPVGGVLTALAVLEDVEPGSKRYREYLEMMRTGLERIAGIVSQLLRFSRQSRHERKEIDLNRMLEEVSSFARLQHQRERIHVVHRLGDIPRVRGAPDLLGQLLMNLAMNAFQAMPDGGILTIATEWEGEVVRISLEDTGPGIDEAVMERIFEPFFTTKEVGEGTGLGLSVALGIVEAHGGTMEAENRDEGGARFTVRLPLHPAEESDDTGREG